MNWYASYKGQPRCLYTASLVYAGVFFLSFPLQNLLPLDHSFFHTGTASVIAIVIIVAGLCFNLPAIRQFAKTKNTLVTLKPAHSLQTSGIYAVSRNPMYLSLVLLYAGLALLFGNWWTLLLLPVLAAIVTYFIIKPEEKYLERAFGKTYLNYKRGKSGAGFNTACSSF